MQALEQDHDDQFPVVTDLPEGDETSGLLSLQEEAHLRRVMRDRESHYRNGFRQRAVVELALYTGAKVNELERLTVGDLFLEAGAPSLRIPSESNPRVLPLTDEMAAFMGDYLVKKQKAEEPLGATDPLMCSQLGTRLTLRGWQAAWALAQKHAGLLGADEKPRMNLEVARRNAGRRIYRIAQNPHHVQAWLGLDVTSNADRYKPEGHTITTETLRALMQPGLLSPELRLTENRSLRLAMGYYNGTIGVMNRPLAKRLFLDCEPEDPRREMWVARGLSRGRCLFPENDIMAHRKAATIIDTIRELAEQDDPMAVYLFASATDEGLALKRDFEKSAELYQRAVDLGVETAITNLALKYHYGSGVEKDDSRAVQLFQRGATLHEGSCMFNLGVMYSSGWGTGRDPQKAYRWFLKAASIGEVRSMNNLSYMLHNGEGVAKDERAAERWYCLGGVMTYGHDGTVNNGTRLEMITVAG